VGVFEKLKEYRLEQLLQLIEVFLTGRTDVA